MASAGVSQAVVYGANRSGAAVPWLTSWPVTREAHVPVTPGEPFVLLVPYHNRIANAERLAVDSEVHWASPDPVATLTDRPAGRATGPVAVGPLPYDQHRSLGASRSLNPLDRGYVGPSRTKSDEEIAAFCGAAELAEHAAEMLTGRDSVGATEHELSALVEAASIARGGSHHIRYLRVTSMIEPDRCVPLPWPSDRLPKIGDLLTFALSASAAPDYAGQLLRTFTVGAEPTSLLADLHDAASAALEAVEGRLRAGVLPAELVEAASVDEAAGFTTVDTLVHDFGGGHIPPVLGSPSRQLTPPPDDPLEAGMTVVVQPNVVTNDRRLGVQTSELPLVTESVPQRLHAFPGGLGRAA